MTDENAAQNTDREIWRETPDDYYSPSVHVTQGGGIGINCGGTVHVRTAQAWCELAAAALREREQQVCPGCGHVHTGAEYCTHKLNCLCPGWPTPDAEPSTQPLREREPATQLTPVLIKSRVVPRLNKLIEAVEGLRGEIERWQQPATQPSEREPSDVKAMAWQVWQVLGCIWGIRTNREQSRICNYFHALAKGEPPAELFPIDLKALAEPSPQREMYVDEDAIHVRMVLEKIIRIAADALNNNREPATQPTPQPSCTHDPNTCEVGFCAWPKCNCESQPESGQ